MSLLNSASIIVIGDEILLGQIQDTNGGYIAGKLSEIGLKVKRIISVGDDIAEIIKVLDTAVESSGIAIITGGLGPTNDDLTRQAVADFFQKKLIHHPELQEIIEKRYSSRGKNMPDIVRTQAYFPQDAEPIPNQHGTAPGIFIRQGDLLCFAVPGVPLEMKGMVDDFIIPKLVEEKRGKPFRYLIIRTSGAGESTISELIGDWKIDGVTLAYLPKFYGVDLRISAHADTMEQAEEMLNQGEQYLTDKIGDFIYGKGEIELAAVIGEILTSKGWKLAVAESCTAGLLSKMITDIPGASRYFRRGFITYSNQAKIDMLGVPEGMLEKYGAVSAEVAAKMAEGAANWAKADFAVAITGIAGPEGGTPTKPVGTVYIAIAHPQDLDISRFSFQDNRENNRLRSTYAALNMLYNILKNYISKSAVER